MKDNTPMMPWRCLASLFTISLALVSTAVSTAAADTREHPYLFFSADQIPEFRQRVQSIEWSKQAYERMVQAVENTESIGMPPPNSNIREEWRPTLRRYPQIASYAAFLYLLDGKPAYLDLAREFLIKYATHFDERINFHNIDDKDAIVIYETGRLGTHSAWTYDMIHAFLTPEERKLVEENLLRAIVETIRRTTEEVSMTDLWAGLTEDTGARPKDYNWKHGQNNMALYRNTGIAAIAFALQDEELIEHSIDNWKIYLERDLMADGMWQEEDYAYSRFCYASMQTVAEMAYQYGYKENLYTWEVEARPFEEFDQGYVETPLPPREADLGNTRTLKMFLDAQIDFQYPDLSAGNWGWVTNRASFLGNSQHVTFYELGYQRYGDPVYGWILNRMDRSRGNGYGQGHISAIIYGGQPIEKFIEPETGSRWYDHSKWVVLKSIEGREYWNSDSIYAFLPYDGVRSKGLRPLSLDLYAYGKVVAPRVAKHSRLQAHDKDYYLTDDSWNAYMVDGQNQSGIRSAITRNWMRFHDFTPEFKIAQASIVVEDRVRASIWYEDVAERDPKKDRIDSRLVALNKEYVIDILDLRHKQDQAYKRHFEWIWHAFGDLTLEGIEDGEITHNQWSATWIDPEDGIGVKTTMTASGRSTGTKVSVRTNAYGSYLRVLRGDFNESFIAIHEPFRDASRIDSIENLWESDGQVALRITGQDAEGKAYTDYVLIAFAADSLAFEKDRESIAGDGHYGYIRVSEGKLVARGDLSAFRITSDPVRSASLNGRPIRIITENGMVSFERK